MEYFRINLPILSVSKKTFDFCSKTISSLSRQKATKSVRYRISFLSLVSCLGIYEIKNVCGKAGFTLSPHTVGYFSKDKFFCQEKNQSAGRTNCPSFTHKSCTFVNDVRLEKRSRHISHPSATLRQAQRGVIMALMFEFLLGRFCFFSITKPDKYTVQGAGTPAVRFYLPQLAVNFQILVLGFRHFHLFLLLFRVANTVCCVL